MLDRRFNTPLTSSAGRLFDAVAALVACVPRVTYEGQAAMELEWLAGDGRGTETYPWELEGGNGRRRASPPSDLRGHRYPADVAGDRSEVRQGVAGRIARRFHSSMVKIVTGVCAPCASNRHRRRDLSGGVFMNVLLMRDVTQQLSEPRLCVYRHHQCRQTMAD